METSETDGFGAAVIAWIQTFDTLTQPCNSLQDLVDGTILTEILNEIDPQWFKPLRPSPPTSSWVLKFNNLKKLYKLLIGYFEEILLRTTTYLEAPQLTLITRDGDEFELLKLCGLVIAVAVQCESNQKFIMRIQGLSEENQHCIMIVIEEIISKLSLVNQDPKSAPSVAFSEDSEEPRFNQERHELERINRNLQEQLESLQMRLDEAVQEKMEIQGKLRDIELSDGIAEDVKINLVKREEIDTLRSELEKSEAQRIQYQSTVESQTTAITELTKKLDDALKKAEEVPRIKDQLDELRHMADKSLKLETMLEKYKKKLEDASDLKRQIKILEDQTQETQKLSQQYQEEVSKTASLKSIIETYKTQISKLEAKTSTFQVENSRLEVEEKELRSKVERLDMEKKLALDWGYSLEEKLKDKENGVEATSNNELNSFDKQIDQIKEASKHSDQEYLILENQLDDANRLKAAFEQKYKEAYQKQLALQNEVDQMKNTSSTLLSDPSPIQQENQKLLKRISELETQLSQQQIQPSSSTTPSPLTGTLMPDLTETRRLNAQLLQLKSEREQMQVELVDARDKLVQFEKMNSELKGAMAALEDSGSAGPGGDSSLRRKLQESVQRCVRLTEQNESLHRGLKSAKEHILWQDKFLKEQKETNSKSSNFKEAMAMYTAQIAEKNKEIEKLKSELNDTRTSARREMKLVLSAWNQMGMKMQLVGAGGKNVGTPGVGVKGAGKKAISGSDSWLNLQRKENGMK
ncbi:Protein Hook 1 [Nowakowskiella sp. JEL0407]|nr:Protein Hook 1 [Nowakowskiella sp. JEL0407]